MADPLAAPTVPLGEGLRRVIHLVPHTHWDREWYLPFETFRLRLVGLVDGLLDDMEADPRIRFTLDGQTATVDDYLELRPDALERLTRLVRAGRLAIGPWAILLDEFLVSGETIVRNLELGMHRAEELGRAMPVGYLPDMFGHVAQMPQILARAGIGDAVVWRGVPQAIDGHAFTWRSPDGSSVRCEYLYRGYGNARDVFDLPDRIERKLDVYVAEMEPWFGSDEILAMYGEDHSLPVPGYAAMIADFDAGQDRYEVRIETLDAYLAATRDASRPTRTWDGELRSSARANVLMGVASHRIEVKQAAGRAERWLERRAEPLAALHATTWPERELALAWRAVIEDSAHDSICACSAEETVQQVLARFATAEQIGRGIAEGTLRSLATAVPRDGWLAFNPSPARRAGLVEIVAPADDIRPLRTGDGTPVEVQELGVDHLVLDDRPVAAAEVIHYLKNRMHSRELYTYLVNGFTLEASASDDRDRLVIDVSRVPDPPVLDIDALLEELAAVAAAADERAPGTVWQVSVVARPQRRSLARIPATALGLTTVVRAPAGSPPAVTDRPVRVEDRRLLNGLVTVEVAADGTLSIAGNGARLAGVGRIVDGGDVGDAYNYAPPARDVVVDAPTTVTVRVAEAGPLRGVIEVDRSYPWRLGLTPDLETRSADAVATLVRTSVQLRAGEPFVRIRVTFENASRDHRVRFLVPLPAPTDRSWTEGQFAVVERGLAMEGGHGEHPLPTFPAHGFAAADGVAALLDHLTEIELVEGAQLALTLLRSTGLISRDMHPWRAEPAGPVIEAPGGQGIGSRTVTFAILPHPGPPDDVVLAALEEYRGGVLVAPGTAPAGVGSSPPVSPGLQVDGPGIVLTSLRRRGADLELRLANETSETRSALVTGPFTGAREASILGEPTGELPTGNGSVRLDLGPWEIRTTLLSS